MPRVTREVEIDRPAHEVYEALNDPDLAPRWSGVVVSADVEGETEVGQEFTITGRFLGVGVDMHCEVTEHDPPRCYAYRSEDPIRMTLESDLEAIDGRTHLEMTVDVDPGALFRLAGPLFARKVRKQLEADLRSLKELLEE
jgi:uncharacterized protein YndB with AHSA1/START domain